MEKNKTGIDGRLEKLALITDALEELFPQGQTAIIVELEEDEFKSIQKNFRDIDRNHKRFKIEISNVEVIFIQKGVEFVKPEPIPVEEPKPEKKINVFTKLYNKLLFRKISG